MDKRIVRVAGLLIVGIFLLLLWLKIANLKGAWGILTSISWHWLIIAAGVYVMGILVRSIRWKLILGHQKRISIAESFNLYLSGQMFNFLIPLRLGELSKSVFLREKEKLPMTKTFPTIIVDKALDFFAPILLIFIAIAFTPAVHSRPIFLILLAATGIGILGVGFLAYSVRRSGLLNKLIRILLFFSKGFQAKITDAMRGMLIELDTISRKRNLMLGCSLLTILAVACDCLFFVAVLRSLHVTFPLFLAAFGYLLILVGYAIPMPPAQVGAIEVIFFLVFSTFLGMGGAEIAAVTVLSHLTQLVLLIGGGLISLSILKIRFSTLLGK